MARLPDDFLDTLRRANPIEDVVGSYVKLSRAGSLLKACCPFHSEKTPSFVVYAHDASPHFYCFGCHRGGSVITFIQEAENVGFMDAVRILADRAGLKIPETAGEDPALTNLRDRILELNRAAARFYYKQLLGDDKRGLTYLAERALKPETIKKYGLGFANSEWDELAEAMQEEGFTPQELVAANLCDWSKKSQRLYDKFRDRVIFPIFDLRGSIIAFGGRTILKDDKIPKYLNSSDTPAFKKGKNLFSMHFARKSGEKRLILAEGYMDVIALNQAGFSNAVASLGTALTPDQCRLMRQYAEEVIISYDSDAAGQNAALKAINLLREVGIQPRILRIEGAKDPDEYIKKFGADRFRLMLDQSVDAVSFELNRCKNGLDVQEEGGAVTALHRAVQVLAGITNRLDRAVYLSRLAKEYQIDVHTLEGEVDAAIRRKQRTAERDNRRELMNSAGLRQAARYTSANGNAAARFGAEETLLWYLFCEPETLERIAQEIRPEHFVNELNRRIYVYYSACVRQGASYSPSLFDSEEFSAQERGYLMQIQNHFDGVSISGAEAEECIRKLLHPVLSGQQVGEMDDDAFRALFSKQ
ncbi:MAG: DNA primase [Oscillospiraceae bacterium]|nr:DNA primase [Oscillospiraceae bacterium]